MSIIDSNQKNNRKAFVAKLRRVQKAHDKFLDENKELVGLIKELDYPHIHISPEAGTKKSPMLLAYEGFNFKITDKAIDILFMGLDEDEVVKLLIEESSL